MMASIITTRMAAANISTSFGIAQFPDAGAFWQVSVHLNATPPASQPCGCRLDG
jgi:hypothetical protein